MQAVAYKRQSQMQLTKALRHAESLRNGSLRHAQQAAQRKGPLKGPKDLKGRKMDAVTGAVMGVDEREGLKGSTVSVTVPGVPGGHNKASGARETGDGGGGGRCRAAAGEYVEHS